VGASQITAAEPLSLHRWISRSRPPNSAAAHVMSPELDGRLTKCWRKTSGCSAMASELTCRIDCLPHLLMVS